MNIIKHKLLYTIMCQTRFCRVESGGKTNTKYTCMNLISLQNNMYVSPILSIYSPVHQSSPSVQSTSPVHSPVHSLDTPLCILPPLLCFIIIRIYVKRQTRLPSSCQSWGCRIKVWLLQCSMC